MEQNGIGQRLYLLLILSTVVMFAVCLLGIRFGDEISISLPVHEKKETPWNLLLVNSRNPLPDDYTMTLVTLANKEMVDERILPDLQAMFDDARSQGIDLFVRSGYRSNEDQAVLFENTVREYMDQGLRHKEAEKEAEKYVMRAGCSEHATGLAVDINTNASGELYTWLSNYAYVYGFVQRYPSDKSDITHVENEPWHYRYVGKEAAKIMVQEGLCLEEYLEKYE
ncbi:MAG: M15 family metallopeptidase [Solobacterium sp.]|nr:M15 family metallopeptidase [Solobacterium sp.]